MGREDARRLDDQRHLQRAFRVPLDAGLHRTSAAASSTRAAAANCDLRPAAYLGGGLEEFGDDAFKRPGGNFPGGGALFFTPPERVEGPPFDQIASGAVPAGPVPGRPGISRNSFRGPRYFNIDATLSKGFGLPSAGVLGDAAKVEFRANFFNLFNQLNLFNVQNNINDSHFGEAQDGLAGRTIEMQVRFSF